MPLNKNNYPIPKEIEAIIDRFAGFTNIPRPSGNEAAMRAHVLAFLPKNGAAIDRQVDDRGNVALNVPASSGCADWPALILQGHMDMVTNGNDTTPTRAYIDNDGWIRAEGTTLGADNGIGVALALETINTLPEQHGPVTALLTVHEESAPMGATELDPTIIPAYTEAVLLNLDAEEGPKKICKGSAASADIEATFSLRPRTDVSRDDIVLSLTIDGLPSGHSGVDIHRGRGNAIRIMAALLTALRATTAFELIALDGGMRHNVIPSTATARLAVPKKKQEWITEAVKRFVRDIQENGNAQCELASEHAGAFSVITEDALADRGAMDRRDTTMILDTLASIDAGVLEQVDGEVGGGVRLSNNIALMTTNDETVELRTLARGAVRVDLIACIEKIKAALNTAGATHVTTGKAEGDWLEPDDSPAVALAVRASVETTGETPDVFAYHAGLECAHILERLQGRIPRRSAVAIGPITKEAHTVNEHMSIPSIAETAHMIAAFVRLLWEKK